jgi:hypothetical protein
LVIWHYSSVFTMHFVFLKAHDFVFLRRCPECKTIFGKIIVLLRLPYRTISTALCLAEVLCHHGPPSMSSVVLILIPIQQSY